MASTKTTVCFSLALLATAFVVSTTADSYCSKAADKALCTQLTNGAKKWEDAMTNALNAVINKAKAAKSAIDSVGGQLGPNVKPITKQSIDSTCSEAYEGVMSNLEECVGLVRDDPDDSLNARLSAAYTSLSDCTDALEEFGIQSSSVQKFGSELSKMNSALLAVATHKDD